MDSTGKSPTKEARLRTFAKLLAPIVVVSSLLILTSSPAAAAPPTTCHVNFKGHVLKAPTGGGASIQSYLVNPDCSVTAGAISTLKSGTPAFNSFRASFGANQSGIVDPGCNSGLQYVDVKGFILTYTWLDMNYAYNYGAGQVTSVGPYYYQASAANDGWYIISTHFSPWSGPIPYGTVTSSYNGTFAWLFGSFWHSGTNNNRADGFGQCDGWPNESGATVPGGKWIWGVWQT